MSGSTGNAWNNLTLGKLFDIFSRLLIAVALVWCGWVARQLEQVRGHVDKVDHRVTAIESNRFTETDAVREMNALERRTDDSINTAVGRLEGKLDTAVQEIRRLSESIARMEGPG